MIGTLLGLAWASWAVVIGWIDRRHRRVSNLWWVAALPMALLTPFVLHPGRAWALFLSLSGLLLALALHLGPWMRGWLGGADLKIYAVIGWGYGALFFLEVFAIASLLLAVTAAIHRLRSRTPSPRIPVLPTMAVSLVAWTISGPWWVGGQGF
ncbi:MAG: prepilin peptidase [Pseudomonadota bacterium]|nr:prepilin peptidase [Pseudomonadota bacterium]